MELPNSKDEPAYKPPPTIRINMKYDDYTDLMSRVSALFPGDNACVFCRKRCIPKSTVGRYICLNIFRGWGLYPDEFPEPTDELYCCDKCYKAKLEETELETIRLEFKDRYCLRYYVKSMHRMPYGILPHPSDPYGNVDSWVSPDPFKAPKTA